jgi:hypothetical protein
LWQEHAHSSWLDHDEIDEDWQPPEPSQEPSRVTRWLSAAAAGVQTALWWLRRYAPRRPVLTTLVIGMTAAVVALSTTETSALVGSALGALAVADLTRAGVSHLATP